MTDEWKLIVNASGHYAYSGYAAKLARLIGKAKVNDLMILYPCALTIFQILPDGIGNCAPVYKEYRPLRDRYKAVLRGGYDGPFRKLRRRVPAGTVLPKLRCRPDEHLCMTRNEFTDRSRLYEEAYETLNKFRKDYATAKREDVKDKGQSTISGFDTSLMWQHR